jgi:hypothetical protein
MPDYRKERDTTILDLVKLLLQLDEAEIHEDNEGNKIQTIYLGDIRSITPSGKVYYPFAHSNVDPCPRCEGTGNLRNKHAKIHNFRRANKKYHTTFQQWYKMYGAPINRRKKQQQLKEKYINQMEQWEYQHICTECNGLGSLEARLDEDFWEQLQSELDTIGAWYHSSEGDGCNILVSRTAREQYD